MSQRIQNFIIILSDKLGKKWSVLRHYPKIFVNNW